MKPWQIDCPAYAFTLDRKQVNRAFAAAGREIAQQARKLIGSGGVSKPGSPPNSRTGTLKRSIKVKPLRKGLGVSIRDSIYYAKFMETGAQGGGRKGVSNKNKRRSEQTQRVMQPRPFLSTALKMRKGSIQKRLLQAIDTGLKFEKVTL